MDREHQGREPWIRNLQTQEDQPDQDAAGHMDQHVHDVIAERIEPPELVLDPVGRKREWPVVDPLRRRQPDLVEPVLFEDRIVEKVRIVVPDEITLEGRSVDGEARYEDRGSAEPPAGPVPAHGSLRGRVRLLRHVWNIARSTRGMPRASAGPRREQRPPSVRIWTHARTKRVEPARRGDHVDRRSPAAGPRRCAATGTARIPASESRRRRRRPGVPPPARAGGHGGRGGALLFVPAALLTAPNGLDSVQMALEFFVTEPAKSVFQRPLGDF